MGVSDLELQRAVVNVYGRVETMTRVIVYEFEDVIVSDLKVDGKKTSALYQRPLPLKKGRFKLTLVVKDVGSGKIGSAESLIAVDPPTGRDKLNASSILLADQITSVSYGEWLPDPFVTSSGLKVYPNVRHEFVQGEPLGVYLEMYGITIDQASSKPDLNVTYEITDQDGKTVEERIWVRVSSLMEERPRSPWYGQNSVFPLENIDCTSRLLMRSQMK